MELFDQNGCLTEEGLHAVIGGQLDELGRLEAAEHLSYCDKCMDRYTALLTADVLEEPPRSARGAVMGTIWVRLMQNTWGRAAVAAVAAVLALTLWRSGTVTQILEGTRDLKTWMPSTSQTQPDQLPMLGQPVQDDQRTMKKNGILTLLFACIPGAGQMYQGYMKRGLSLITMFCLFIIVGSATGLDALVVGCIVVYMYSFFDTFNLRAQIIAENAPADDYLVHINWKDKRMQDFMMDSHKLLGWGLIALGGLVAYENVIMRVFGDVMWRWGQNNPVFRAFYLMLDELPQIVTCVALIVCGLWLVRGPKGKKVHRKKAEEPEDEDFREYTAAEADAPEAPEETADFAMPKLSALLGDPVTPEDPDEPEQPENAEGDDGRTE